MKQAAAVLAAAVVCGCAYRDNVYDPQSPYFVPAAGSIRSVQVDPDSVCRGDSINLAITVRRAEGDSAVYLQPVKFELAGTAYVVVELHGDGESSAVVPVEVVECGQTKKSHDQ